MGRSIGIWSYRVWNRAARGDRRVGAGVDAFAAATTFSGQLGGESLENQQQAVAHARDELGAEHADALTARVESMSYDEMVDYLRTELDRAIASA